MISPVEQHGAVWLKRDDLHCEVVAHGAKARVMAAIADREAARGTRTLVASFARNSSVPAVMTRVAQQRGLAAHIHSADSAQGVTDELLLAERYGASVYLHRPGYQSVLSARARADAEQSGGFVIPLGLEDELATETLAGQVANLPAARRLVMPVGSGMMLAGVLHGLRLYGIELHVLGVCVGQRPEARLDRWAPEGWRRMVTLVQSAYAFTRRLRADVDGVLLDPVYEAKCRPYLRAGDVLWLVALRSGLREGIPCEYGCMAQAA